MSGPPASPDRARRGAVGVALDVGVHVLREAGADPVAGSLAELARMLDAAPFVPSPG